MEKQHKQLLNGVWKFIVDADNSGEQRGFQKQDIFEETWREVPVPSVFETCLLGLQDYPGVCWFRRVFEVPTDLSGERLTLHFEGVNYVAKVWINGIEAGSFEQGYLPFEFDITELVKEGLNTLAVKVNGARHPGQLPPTHFWRHQGGIIRDVYLTSHASAFIAHVDVTGQPIPNGGQIDICAKVMNQSGQQKVFQVAFSLWNADGEPVEELGTVPVEMIDGEMARVSLSKEVEGVAWWSPDSPALYTVKTLLKQGEEVIGEKETTTGFRKVEVVDGKIHLNGKELFLVGFNRHEDSKETHMAVNRENSRRDFTHMKEMGANFVRMCHYPHDSGELDLCDQLGLLVLDEIPLNAYLLSFPFKNNKEQLQALPEVRRNAEFMLDRMVRRDKHHPCVVFWSVSNETAEHMEEVRELNNHLLQYVRQLDSSRLIVHVTLGSTWLKEYCDQAFIYDDVICVNSYDFCDQVRKDYLEGRPYDKKAIQEFWMKNVERMKELYPGKPVIATEFGFKILPGKPPEAEEQMQADYLALIMEAAAPYLAGYSVWAYADHDWPQVWPQMEDMFGGPISTFGLVSQDRSHQRKACEVFARLARG